MRLSDLKGSVIKPGLETVSELLRRLGNPQLKFKSVHIAGTNGKGSCAAILHETLIRAGYRVGIYTSPHLHRFNERVKMDRVEISDTDLTRLDEAVGEACEGIEPTYFEYTTAMAFLYFAEKNPDIAIVEVGLGGRLDATNPVDPLVTIITPLSIDHREFLGNDIKMVAHEKAGIMKPGVKAVISRQPPEAMEIIEKHAQYVGAPLIIEGRDFDTDTSRYPLFDFKGRFIKLDGLRCGLIGRHQSQNCATALASAEVLMEAWFKIPVYALREGVEHVKWPGRLELFSGSPPILVDGAHNAGGAEVLAKALGDDFPDKIVQLIIGMQVTKDLNAVLSILAPRISGVHAVPLREVVYFDPSEVAEAARKLGVEAHAYKNLKDAIKSASEAAGAKGMVLIAGSLYLAGEATELLGRAG